MRYVIIRDDDTNVLTPPECLERLYRPFLRAGLPVNLATIPAVSPNVKRPDGQPEAFLWKPRGNQKPVGAAPGVGEANEAIAPLCLTAGDPLVQYLRSNPGFHLVQHGCHHDPFEFDRDNREEIVRRLDLGRNLFRNAGLPIPETFVAPHDKFSRSSYQEIARRFQVISTGWFELRRLPYGWWPHYAFVKARKQAHWHVNGTALLSHPGCLLSYLRPYPSMLDTIKAHIQRQSVTVLVTHWWEYFREGIADDAFIGVLHSVADYLAQEKQLRVISFKELADRKLSLN